MEKASATSYTAQPETFDSLKVYWRQSGQGLRWDCLFVLPAWLKVWWHHFGNGSKPFVLSISSEDRLLGIAPTRIKGDTVQFLGDASVCDYLDFVVCPERVEDFYRVILHHLKKRGIRRLALEAVREDSSTYTDLLPLARQMGYPVKCESQDVSFEMRLPNQWDEYIGNLNGKERHEIRRKLRRLDEAGRMNFRLVDQRTALESEMDTFLMLFRSNRKDKAGFMSDRMSAFFRDLAVSFSKERILKIFFLEMDAKPAAAVMCFDYQSTRYLYNNGYDQQYRPLSVGTISKVLSIKEGIRSKKKMFDFLKGSERYKHRLGGKPVAIYRCEVEIR